MRFKKGDRVCVIRVDPAFEDIERPYLHKTGIIRSIDRKAGIYFVEFDDGNALDFYVNQLSSGKKYEQTISKKYNI